jgi:hypothetical protein
MNSQAKFLWLLCGLLWAPIVAEVLRCVLILRMI